MTNIRTGKVFSIVGANVNSRGFVISFKIKNNNRIEILFKDKQGYFISEDGEVYLSKE